MEHAKLIPRAISEVTPEWLEAVFILHNTQLEDVKSAKVTSLTPITEKLGYLSSSARATVSLTNGRQLKLFIKVIYQKEINKF